MRESHEIKPDLNYLRELGYETQDVDAKGLLKWAVYLFVFLGAVTVIGYGVYKLFIPQISDRPAGPPALLSKEALPVAPNPLLQGDPMKDIAAFRANENEILDSYGRVKDKDNPAAVRIPIDHALELTAKEGLPVRSGAKAVSPPPQEAPAPSGSETAPSAQPGGEAQPGSARTLPGTETPGKVRLGGQANGPEKAPPEVLQGHEPMGNATPSGAGSPTEQKPTGAGQPR